MVSSSVRIFGGWERGRATSSWLIAPPRQRMVRWAWAASRSTVTMTSSSRARSSSLRSRSVVVAERADGRPLVGGQGLGAALLATGQLGLGRRDLGELVLPVALQAAGDQPVVGVDGQVAPLRQPGLEAGPLDLQAPLPEGGVVVGLQALGGGHRRVDAGGGERGQERLGDRLVELDAADAEAGHAPAAD